MTGSRCRNLISSNEFGIRVAARRCRHRPARIPIRDEPAPKLLPSASRPPIGWPRSTGWPLAFSCTGVQFFCRLRLSPQWGWPGCLYVLLYRPDRQIDDAAARRPIQAASDGAVASLSYSSDSMARDFAAAKPHLTVDFLAYYDKFTKDIVTPTVQEKHVAQTAVVLRAAIRAAPRLSRCAGIP